MVPFYIRVVYVIFYILWNNFTSYSDLQFFSLSELLNFKFCSFSCKLHELTFIPEVHLSIEGDMFRQYYNFLFQFPFDGRVSLCLWLFLSFLNCSSKKYKTIFFYWFIKLKFYLNSVHSYIVYKISLQLCTTKKE